MAKSINASLKNIENIFSNGQSQDLVLGREGIFIIPDYQRAYSWRNNEHCDKLWQDIDSFIERERDETYFFGSVIINSKNDELHVIDGQQRITTFMLLIKALLLRINEILKDFPTDSDSEELKDALIDRRKEIVACLYIIDKDKVSTIMKHENPFFDQKIKYKNESINEEFRDEVENILKYNLYSEIEAAVHENRYRRGENRRTNFFRNFKYFHEKLQLLDSSRINRIAKALLKECEMIIIISYQEEAAIEIFNSLNSTGLPLADADIISAKLYQNIGGDEFRRSWNEIIKTVNSLSSQKIVSIDDILNQYMYILKAKDEAVKNKAETTIPGVRRYFTDINSSILKNPMKFVEDINKIIDIWNCIDDTQITTVKSVLLAHNSNFKFFYATYFYYNENKPK